MGIFDASQSSGGSAQSSASNAYGYAQSDTNGAEAREWSAAQAAISRAWQEQMMEKQMAFNSAEAQKERDWQQNNINIANEMANTVYTRAAKNMKEAGINPILAYSSGLGGVGNGVTSGASAATASLPSGAMGQSFADQHSASEQWSNSKGSGSSWQHSESGLATALEQMAGMFGKIADGLNSGLNINIKQSVKDIVEDFLDPYSGDPNYKTAKDIGKEMADEAQKKKQEEYNAKWSNKKGYSKAQQGKEPLGAGRGSEKVVY